MLQTSSVLKNKLCTEEDGPGNVRASCAVIIEEVDRFLQILISIYYTAWNHTTGDNIFNENNFSAIENTVSILKVS